MSRPEMGEMDPRTQAQKEFSVDIDDDRAVMAKVVELAKARNYDGSNRLGSLWQEHQGSKAERRAA